MEHVFSNLGDLRNETVDISKVSYDMRNGANLIDLLKRYFKFLMEYKKEFDVFINEVNNSLSKSSSLGRENMSSDEYDEYRYNLKNTYTEAKDLVDDIYRQRSTLETNVSNLHDQQVKIEALERRFRKSLAQMDIDSDEYKNKKTIIDQSLTIANDFVSQKNVINQELQDIRDSNSKAINDIKKLSKYVQDHNNWYEEKITLLTEIIKKSKDVLGNASTAAVGLHFKQQYDRSKRYILLWPTLGGSFLMGAISICILTVFPEVFSLSNINSPESHPSTYDDLHYIISRLLVAPLFLAGAWFCANQYVKQKNIIEDYAYKKVLTLSLLSIKSELEKTGFDNATDFIKAFQVEILKSPLDSLDRKHLSKEVKLLNAVQNQIFSNLADKLRKSKNKKDKVSK
ncbi:hypothetical protein H4F49_05165 [Pectobacterium polaris]|nr:hypothetical protein [Pectobacterium polaris]MBN3080017.1 hypothetical protein [Pectobacterium polaris]